MMPASTTLASSQPRWGDQKAPITAAPKTSQNPFRHLVGRGAPCVSASSKAPAGHAAVERSRPAFIGHRNYPFVVVRRYRVQGSAKGWRRRTRIWREATTRANPGEERGGQRYFRGACAPRVPPSSGKRKWRRRTDVWREATSPARGFRRLTSDGSAAHSSWRCQLAESPLRGLSAAGLFPPFGGASSSGS